MSADPQVELIFQHFTPRYVATGVEMNDLIALRARIGAWSEWCREWSKLGAMHEALGDEAEGQGRMVTAREAWLRAAIAYHYGKHLFGADPVQFTEAHNRMRACYGRAAPLFDQPAELVEFPYEGTNLVGWLRRPTGVAKAPVAIILPGLDACKEELHEWSEAFLQRGLATVTLDGPGQGETAFKLPITPHWGRVLGAVIDVLEQRSDVDGTRCGVIGQSFGAFYAPLAASGEPRLKACVANCGAFDIGAVLPQMPVVSQDLFRIRAWKPDLASAMEFAKALTLANGVAEKIACPLLVVFGGGDKIIPASEGERLAKAASGEVEFVVYPEGNHVCFNIPYKFRPLTADWTAEVLNRP